MIKPPIGGLRRPFQLEEVATPLALEPHGGRLREQVEPIKAADRDRLGRHCQVEEYSA